MKSFKQFCESRDYPRKFDAGTHVAIRRPASNEIGDHYSIEKKRSFSDIVTNKKRKWSGHFIPNKVGKNSYVSAGSHLHSSEQGKDLMNRVYDRFEKKTKGVMVPSSKQTYFGKKLWAKRLSDPARAKRIQRAEVDPQHRPINDRLRVAKAELKEDRKPYD